jgi:hypothetical protein
MDSEGKKKTEHYTTTEKVITHTAKEILNPVGCYDESGEIEQP